MAKVLYDIFEKAWKKTNSSSIWLISDTHFGDTELSQKGLRDITPEEQVKRINSKVGKNDTIICLGDVGDPSYFKQIRGYKILIQGNHDKGKTVYEEYFDEVYDGELIISSKIKLTHLPILSPYILDIHGHCHPYKKPDFTGLSYDKIIEKQLEKAKKSELPALNLCADYLDFYPINLNVIVKSGLLKLVKNPVRELIDSKDKK